jgi:hypothetical protein
MDFSLPNSICPNKRYLELDIGSHMSLMNMLKLKIPKGIHVELKLHNIRKRKGARNAKR